MKPNPSDKRQGPGEKDKARQQQQSGEGNQYGEGSYSGTRQYNEGLKDHVEHHDIEREARDAEPRTASEEKEMDEAERYARGKSRGEGASPDGGADDPKRPSGS